jgi:SAM-dependent methyltransferase
MLFSPAQYDRFWTRMTGENPSEQIRAGYERIAEEYARHIFNELRDKPFDRDLLTRFAIELKGRGEICDMGCGPGHVARFLRDAGAAVFGLDLSPRMAAIARQLNPDISFREGDMLALNLPSSSLAGIVAFYAIVNFPDQSLPQVFREMSRVLQPGGRLLLSFHIGDEMLHVDELWGIRISLDFFLFPPDRIRGLLKSAGFHIKELLEREPYAPEVEYQSRRAYILAEK